MALLNLVSRVGHLDISFQPSGTGGFDDLIRSAIVIEIRGRRIPVAALEDIIRSKEAANRPKDQRSLPMLRRLLAEVKKRDGQQARAATRP